MRSSVAALTWEIWRRNRRTTWLVLGIILFGWLFNSVLPDGVRATVESRERLLTVNGLLCVASLLLVFSVFNYSEFNPQKDWTGFPYRLFALPVATWLLVLLPMSLGIAAVELVYMAGMKLAFAHDPLARPEWLAVLIGAYMTFYQTIIWGLAGFRILRLLVLGIAGTSLIGVASLPSFEKYILSPWLSEKVLIRSLVGLSLAAFVTAWICVARQRCGGGRRRDWVKAWIDGIADVLPRRVKSFASPVGAQFWFEWRRSGLLLPRAVGALLVFVIAPLSWIVRKDADSAWWILGWTLGMPVILAVPVGKGFSKPDFWSSDLSLSPFQAVRPMATGEMVVIKMKVAALSAALSWLLVAAFLSVWLPLWADLTPMSMIRIGFWMIYDHSVYPQYVIAALSIIAGMILTWKCLISGLWIGLSGNRRFFVASAAFYCGIAFAGIISLVMLFEQKEVRAWIHDDPNRLLSHLEWLVALGIIGKFWLATFSWREISPQRVRKYLLIWLGGTFCLMSLALLLWAGGRLYLPLDADRLRNFLILITLLVVPLARIGLAPSALAGNRRAGPILNQGSFERNEFLSMVAAVASGVVVVLATRGQTFSRVDAGGPILRMLMAGSGNSTVVFESGAGGPLETWLRIQPEVSKFSRTISYDRAGNGLSQKGPVPRDGRRIAIELHTALHNAHASPPYILVGHSLGGPYMRIFAGLYPDEVAGLVLVDPTQEELIAWVKARDPKPSAERTFRPDDEVDCAPATFAQAQENPIPAKVPVFILGGMGPSVIPGFLTKELREEVLKDQSIFYPAKLKFYRKWLEKIPEGRLIITENSGHGIPFEEPELVIKAIREIVDRTHFPTASRK